MFNSYFSPSWIWESLLVEFIEIEVEVVVVGSVVVVEDDDVVLEFKLLELSSF